MKRNSWVEIFIGLLIGLQTAVALWAYPSMPERIPTHWNIRGEANGFMAKGWGLSVPILLNLALYVLFLAIPWLDPKGKLEQSRDAYQWIRVCVHALVTGVSLAAMAAALGHPVRMDRLVPFLVSFSIIVIGNLMGRIHPNRFVGIRTPWTLDDPIVWEKTHGASGPIWMAAGAIGMIGSLLGGAWTFALLLGPILAAAVFSVVYSWHASRSSKAVPGSR